MPIIPYTLQRRVERFRDQRWLLDKVIETVGPEFDQPRLQYYAAPMSADHRGPVMGLKALIHRWDDLTREFARLARRYELQARASLAQGHEVTAGDGFFSASVMYGAAQWPIFANTELNLALERKKTDCFTEFTKLPITASRRSRFRTVTKPSLDCFICHRATRAANCRA